MGRVIMIASGKGGTGKSTMTVNLGMSLAFAGYHVLLMDMNTGLRTLDLYLGLENRALFDIGDVISGICGKENAILKFSANENLCLLPGSQKSAEDTLNKDTVCELIDGIRDEYDFILLDCPPGIGEVIDICNEVADEAIIVVNADYAALRDADALEDKLIRNGMYARSYIINGLSISLVEKEVALQSEVIDERMRCEMLGIVLDDINIKASTNQGVPITIKRDTYIAANFDKIAERLLKKEQI